MERVKKVLLMTVILLAYIGVVWFGVMLVISDTEMGRPMLVSYNTLGKAVGSKEKQLQQPIKDTLEWIEQETAVEKKVTQYIEKKLEEMTLEQKLAQMMILTNEHDIIETNLRTYQPGGIIFFEVDFSGKTLERVKSRISTLQSYMQTPLLVGVDEEGGEVSRLKTLAEPNVPAFRGARSLTEEGKDAVRQDTFQKMQYLKEMGINLNFAPVADIVNSRGSYMYARSAGGEAKVVSEYVETVLSVMQDQQVIGCVKHFPGYGDNVNTHDGLAHDSRTLAEYEEKDFLPFQAGIEVGVDMLMVSHIIMESVDKDNPASLSLKVHDILRDDFGFDGVVIADDLNMQAILENMTIEEATAKAFLAGNDMIFSANFAASMKGAISAVNQGLLTEEQIDESVGRILRMKIKNELIVLEDVYGITNNE